MKKIVFQQEMDKYNFYKSGKNHIQLKKLSQLLWKSMIAKKNYTKLNWSDCFIKNWPICEKFSNFTKFKISISISLLISRSKNDLNYLIS